MKQLIDAINDNPSDFETRAVYVDWLEERGDPSAAGWRVLNETGRVPYLSTNGRWTFWMEHSTGFHVPPPAVIPSFFMGWYVSEFIALEAAAERIVELTTQGIDIEADKWPGQRQKPIIKMRPMPGGGWEYLCKAVGNNDTPGELIMPTTQPEQPE